jgi:hypothetical protein
MIVQGKNKLTGGFYAEVYNADNKLFATLEGDNRDEVQKAAEQLQREALASIIPIQPKYDNAQLEIDEELLAALGL